MSSAYVVRQLEELVASRLRRNGESVDLAGGYVLFCIFALRYLSESVA